MIYVWNTFNTGIKQVRPVRTYITNLCLWCIVIVENYVITQCWGLMDVLSVCQLMKWHFFFALSTLTHRLVYISSPILEMKQEPRMSISDQSYLSPSCCTAHYGQVLCSQPGVLFYTLFCFNMYTQSFQNVSTDRMILHFFICCYFIYSWHTYFHPVSIFVLVYDLNCFV